MRRRYVFRGSGRLRRFLDGRLPWWAVTVGWVGAAVLFVEFAGWLGGTTKSDAGESLVPAAAIAHGQFACAYPRGLGGVSLAAPLFPALSAAAQSALRLGQAVPYPLGAIWGSRCTVAFTAMTSWVANPGVLHALELTGYLGVIALAAGVIALLGAERRLATRWSLLLAALLVVTMPVALVLTEFFHPEDALCLGACFGAIAALRRERYLWVGVLVGIALLAQQFALLAVVPLALAMPPRRLTGAALAGLGTMAVLLVPLGFATQWRIWDYYRGAGDTSRLGPVWLSELDLHGTTSLTVVSRVLPLVVGLVVAAALRWRLGADAYRDTALVYVVALAFAWRLIFEINLYGYYFLAVSVTLVVADVLARRVRPLLVLWLAIFAWYFFPTPSVYPPYVSSFPVWTNDFVLAATATLLAVTPLVRLWRRAPQSVAGTAAVVVASS